MKNSEKGLIDSSALQLALRFSRVMCYNSRASNFFHTEKFMTKLARTLEFRDLLFIVIGSVIGSGIFLTPGGVLSQVGGAVFPALMVWLVGGLLSLLGAFTYGELSATN